MLNKFYLLRNTGVLFTFLSSLSALVLTAEDSKVSADSSWCEKFDKAQRSGLPLNWSKQGAKLGVPMTSCNIKDSVLQVHCNKSTGGIAISPKVDLNKTPVMRWRWRVKKYPPEADGRNPQKDDQAVAIYVGMNDGMLKKKSIAYRWETLTPKAYEGTTTYAKVLSVHYIVMQNSAIPAGTWITETRNIVEDFKRVYGKVPTEFAISVNGNSQYTKSDTLAEIDFIEFIPQK